MARWLTGRTGEDGFDMSLDQLLFAVLAEREAEREEVFRNAISARAAQAGAKEWKKFVKDFGLDGDQ